MTYILTVVVFLIVFSILILIHELGHFIMAKRSGIKVEEFGMGLPPRAWGKKKGETIYSINWIPFGGFVKMLGESFTDAKAMKKKRSFAHQSAWTRTKVVVAGVVMNFFLAWLLLTVALMIGIHPLSLGMQILTPPDEIVSIVTSGDVALETGLKIKSVEDNSIADKYGFIADDILYSIDGAVVNIDNFETLRTSDVQMVEVVRDGVREMIDFINPREVDFLEDMGFDFYDYMAFSRLVVVGNGVLNDADVILSVNGNDIYDVDGFESSIDAKDQIEFTVLRMGEKTTVVLPFDQSLVDQKYSVSISAVLEGSPAFEAGLMADDIVVSIDDFKVNKAMDLIDYVSEQDEGEALNYSILRDSDIKDFVIVPEDGKVGIFLSELASYENGLGFSIQEKPMLNSVIDVKFKKYPIYQAVYKSVVEGWAMSKSTVAGLGDFAGSLLKNGSVPDGVAGPIGIAQMTHFFVQDGFVSLLVFVAILSLSLGVLNILPIPALDGGRLLFIIIEVVTRKRLNPTVEAYVHAIGYVLLLGLIILVTYGDIMRFFR